MEKLATLDSGLLPLYDVLDVVVVSAFIVSVTYDIKKYIYCWVFEWTGLQTARIVLVSEGSELPALTVGTYHWFGRVPRSCVKSSNAITNCTQL